MRRSWPLAIALVAVGALPATAVAKNVTAIKVCGASGCKSVEHPARWSAESRGVTRETFEAPVGRYYRVEMTVSDRGKTVGTDVSYWLPGPGLMHGSQQSGFDKWWGPTRHQNEALHAAAAGIEPLSPTLSRVVVAGRAVADPSSYIELFGYFPISYRYAPEGARWITITVTPAHPNPWVDRKVTLRYQPKLRLLQRPGYEQVMLPDSLGRLLAPTSGGGSKTALYAGLGAGALAALGLAALIRQRRRNGRGER
jgi:hypothetical protein